MMRGTFPDTNRLSLVTQRRFHTAWDEMRGSRVQIVPTVARELTTNVIVQAANPGVPGKNCRYSLCSLSDTTKGDAGLIGTDGKHHGRKQFIPAAIPA